MRIEDSRRSSLPPVYSLQVAFRTLENAVARARFAPKKARYQKLLRELPTWFLEGLTNTTLGDGTSGRVLITLTARTGWLIHNLENPALVRTDPNAQDKAAELQAANQTENEVISRVAPRIMRDCAREHLRRSGVLKEFEPAPDPFGLVYITSSEKIVASARGFALTGDSKKLLDTIISGDAS